MDRKRALVRAVTLIFIAALTAAVYMRPSGPVSITLLYLAPLLLAAVYLPRNELLALVALSVVLRALLGSRTGEQEWVSESVLTAAAFAGSSLFVSEVVSGRDRVRHERRRLEAENALRKEAEEQLRILTETSPAAILTIDRDYRIRLANRAAHEMLRLDDTDLSGHAIGEYFPLLAGLPWPDKKDQSIRTTLECKGRRKDGEVFPAHVWLSGSAADSDSLLAAIILDTSEELRDREAMGFEQIMKSSSILVRAVSHEIRNVCAAICVVHANLRRLPGLQRNEDFEALGTLAEGLGKLVSSELRPDSQRAVAEADLSEVLDELRIIIEPSFAEEDAVVRWMIPEGLPRVSADRYGLLHVFMNLARNSQRAVRGRADRRLVIAAAEERGRVAVRFTDSGGGVARPDLLFQPFQHAGSGTGLGLYLSRAIARSYAGDLTFEPQAQGACFVVTLPVTTRNRGTASA